MVVVVVVVVATHSPFGKSSPPFGRAAAPTTVTTLYTAPHVQTPKSKFQNQNIQNSKIQTPKSKLQNQKSRLRNPKSKIRKSKFQIQLPPTTKGLTYTTIIDLSKVYNGPRTISDPTLLRTLGFRYFRPLVVEGIKLREIMGKLRKITGRKSWGKSLVKKCFSVTAVQITPNY